jgi:hypothetical protein
MLRPAKQLTHAARGTTSNDASELLRGAQHDVLGYTFNNRQLLAQALGLG